MLAIDWRAVVVLVAELFVTFLAAFGITKARKIRILALRAVAVSLCAIVALLGSLCTLAFLALSSCESNSHSALIYSPSQKIAARTNDFDYGATGGDSTVTLHWAYGLRSETVYSGGWKSVTPQDVHWKSDSALTIYYDSSYGVPARSCSSTSQVTVACVPR